MQHKAGSRIFRQGDPADAVFYIQFFRERDAPMVPGVAQVDVPNRAGPWEHRGRDLDSAEEIFSTMISHKVRRLPVIDGRRLVGMVSLADAARALSDPKAGQLIEALSTD